MGLIKIYGFPLRHPQQVMAFMNLHEYLNLATKRNNPRLTHYYNPHMLRTIWSQSEPHFFMVWKGHLDIFRIPSVLSSVLYPDSGEDQIVGLGKSQKIGLEYKQNMN